MEEVSRKADVLIEAMKWIREHRGATVVVKLGGSLMEDEIAMMHLFTDLVFMESVGIKPVVVHGGGAAISQAMKDAGIEPRFVQGRRYTDDATLAVVREELAHKISKSLVDSIKFYSGSAVALSDCFDTNVLYGRKTAQFDADGAEIDLGWVGEVTRVEVDKIREYCDRGVIPVIPSYTIVDDGGRNGLNVNADVAATEVAKQLGADKLVFVSEVNGVRTDPNDPASMINSLTAEAAKKLLASGAIVGGMIPKIQSCLKTLERGVKKIHIINGRIRHALLLEIFTSQGVGTEIVQD
ncbi:MAG: acetylglutamate kinase [Thermoguttaceae bacterium]|nr:acetylglutamate kinase [Thermoguttaceae bacterium]MBR4104445.1 acetylglutamate kinase [Thermoguttaceae bacterium]